jgi:hypothetical protein
MLNEKAYIECVEQRADEKQGEQYHERQNECKGWILAIHRGILLDRIREILAPA